jgi:hypothetical protein
MPRMSKDDQHPLEKDICVHIFTVSAGMLGVCLTVIGILRIIIIARKADTLADDLVSGDAVLFLISCALSYWALRTRSVRRMYRVERFADAIFLAALVLMAFICAFITYAMAAI